MSEISAQIGSQIRTLRKKRKMTLDDLSGIIHKSRSTISKYEKGEIAMLKSIGFQHKTIQKWQMMRMAFVVIVAMIVSIPLSLLSNTIVLKPIFAIMGAQVNIQVDPLQAYLIYPGILLIGIMISTLIATHSVKNINIREMNNLE